MFQTASLRLLLMALTATVSACVSTDRGNPPDSTSDPADAEPDAAPDAAPDVAPDVAPDAPDTPDAPDAASDAPDAASDAPDAASDAPDDTPDAPDAAADAADAADALDSASDADLALRVARRALVAESVAEAALTLPGSAAFAPGALEYTVAAPLFSDGTTKSRAAFVPVGARVQVADDGSLAWPDGTVLAKWFLGRDAAAVERPIELRLLVLLDGRWEARSFVWDDALGDGPRVRTEATLSLSLQPDRWSKPSEEQCVVCHGPDPLRPLATDVRQLRHSGVGGDLLDRLVAVDALAPSDLVGLPPGIPVAGDRGHTVESAARAALHGSCAHCHRAGGSAGRSGLWLGWTVDDPARLGFCVDAPAGGPVLEGATQLIAPGSPDQSVLWRRMVDARDGVRMPELGALRVDGAGAAAVEAWIRSLPVEGCSP